MLSKNNFKERLRKMEPRKERFSIRKFSVGAASVLIGFFFMGMGQGQTVRAADTTQNDVNVEQPSSTQKTDVKSDTTTDQSTSEATTDSKASAAVSATKVITDAAADKAATDNATKVQVEDSTLDKVPEGNVKTSQGDAPAGKQSDAEDTKQAQGATDVKQTPVTPSGENQGEQTPANGQGTGNVDKTPAEKPAGTTTQKEAADKTTTSVKTPAQPAAKDGATKVVVNKDTKTDSVKGDANKQVQLDKITVPTLDDIQKQFSDIENKLAAGTLTEDDAAKATEDLFSKMTAAQRAALGITTLDENPTQSEDVSDWSGFVSALENANVGIINLTHDITVDGKADGQLGGQSAGYNGCLTLDANSIARKLIINGKDLSGTVHQIDFGHYSLMFENNNQKNGKGWDITFSNVHMKGVASDSKGSTSTFAPGTFGLISLADVSGDNQKKIAITLNDVTANVTGRPIISGAKANKTGEHYILNLSGTNDFTNEGYDGGLLPADDGSALEAGKVNVTGGTTTINMTKTSGYNLQYGGNAIRTADNGTSVTVAEGATLSITGGKDVRGIFTGNGIDSTVEVNGTLNENMGDGHSMGIFTGNLNVGEKGTVYIQTKQDNNGVDGWGGTANFNSHHYAPISIGVGNASNVANAKNSTLNIASGGTVRIIRSATSKTTESPLISFGAGASGNTPTDRGHFILNVNQGATLDLQDAAQYKASENPKHRSGLISMWGEGSYITGDEIHITNPKLLNLQRTGAQTGNLIRLEAKNNHVYITGTTPVAQWDNGNTDATKPSFAWSVQDLTTQNAFGDFSIKGYVPAGDTEYTRDDPKTTLIGSNAILTMGANQAGKDSYKYENGTSLTGTPTDGGEKGVDYVSPYYNQLLNHFNWWTSQRIAMGSDLLPSYSDAQKYAPEAKEIDTNTSHKLGDEGVTVKDGIKDVLDQDGNVSSDGYNAIDWTKSHWYNSSDDTEYKNQFGTNATLPSNPTGNLKTTDTSAVATIVYGDGSTDFVTVPLKVTEPSIADQQTPDGGSITVPERHTLTSDDAKNAITNNTQLHDVSGYTWKTAPDTTIPGTKSGVVTVTYTDNSTDDVPVTVNVQSLADQYDPKGQDIQTNQGIVPNANKGISNTGDLPSDTTYTWNKEPDVSKPGTVPGVVKVTYSDGSEDQVPINVIVGNPSTSTTKTDADKNNPQSQNIKTIIGTVPDAQEGISNTGDLPSGTTYTWSQTPNVYSKGDHPAVVKVTYPDSSIDYVPTTVTVTNEPTGKNITTDPTHVPDATTSIDWGNGTKPGDTTITWVTQPNVSKPGDTTGTAKITYPDGETTTVVVPIHVTDPGSTDTAFDPYGTTIRVPYGHELKDTDAQNGIAGGVPTNATDVTYTWKYAPATSGTNIANTTQQGYVTVKGTLDGKSVSKDVIVYVRVGDQAENYDLKGQNIAVSKGAPVPEAKSGVSDTPALPIGTQYEWGFAPDTNSVGTQSTLVKVTYPDGSFSYVPQNVIVYSASYDGINVERPTDNSTVTQSETPNTNAPTRTHIGYQKGTFTDPTGTTITIGNDGKVTVTVTKDANLGTFNVPVEVTYPDVTTATTVYVPVSITGEDINHNGDHTYYGNQSQTIMKAVPTDVHKTSDNFIPDAAKSGFNEIIHNYDWDGTSGNGNYRKHTTYKLGADGNFHKVNADGTLSNDPNDMFAASKISYTWMTGYTPNTNFGDQTQTVLAKNPDGSFNPAEQTGRGDNLPGNSKYRVNVSITDTSVTAMLGLGFRPYSSWNNVYFNFYGAKSDQTLTFNQNSDISNLSQDQYRQLIDVTDLGKDGWNGTNVDPNTPQALSYVPGTDASKKFTMTWAPNGKPSTATVATGVPGTVRISFSDGTYLDVLAHINVENTDAAKYEPKYNDTTVNATDPVDTGVPSFTSDNQPATAPTGTKFAFSNGRNTISITDKNGQNSVTATIDTNTGKITFTAPDAATEYDIAVTVTYPDSSTDTPKARVFVNKTVDPTKVDPTDPSYKDMFKTVTRDIITTPVSGSPTTEHQSLDFGRTMTIYGNGQASTYGNWEAGKINGTAFTTTGGSTEFPTHAITPVTGYTSYYKIGENGSKITATTVPSASALDENGNPTNGTTVYVSYDNNNDVVPYDPNNKDMNKYVTRTIEVYEPGSTTPAETPQKVHFGRTGVKDADGHITYGGWTRVDDNNHLTSDPTGTWKEFNIPVVNGWQPTVDGQPATSPTIAAQTVNGDTKDVTVIIGYTRTYDPTDPSINPNNPGENDDMYAHPTRTIHVINPDGSTRDTVQTVWFGRTKTVSTDPNVKHVVYGDWQLGKVENNKFSVDPTVTSQWGKFDVPQIDGYTSYIDGVAGKVVGAQNVSPETKDITVKVTYSKDDNGGGTTPTNPGGGDHGGDKPGDKPDNKPGDNNKPDDNNKTPDDNNKTPDNGGKKNNTKKHAHKSKTNKTKHGKTSKGYRTNSGVHGESGNTGVHGQRGNGNGQNVAPQHETMNTPAKSANNTNGANSTKAKAQTLPQTGTTDNKVGLIGLAIAAIGGLFGLAAGKKRKEDE